MSRLQIARDLVVATGKETLDDDVPSLAAAIAYYTIFSLPPLLVTIVAIAGAVVGPERIVDALSAQIGGLAGGGTGEAIRDMITEAGSLGDGLGAKAAGLAALLFGATGAFGQLQKGLNRAWEVEAAAGGGLVAMLFKRFLSFGMVVTVALLLLVSLVLDASLAAAGDAIALILPSAAARLGITVAGSVISLLVTAGLFAVVFKVLPDAEIRWRDVLVGAFATAVLFAVGREAIGFYVGTSDPGSAFGAAGALALLMLWIYYTTLILLVGAEFTQIWATRFGQGIVSDGSELGPAHPAAVERDPAPRSGITPPSDAPDADS